AGDPASLAERDRGDGRRRRAVQQLAAPAVPGGLGRGESPPVPGRPITLIYDAARRRSNTETTEARRATEGERKETVQRESSGGSPSFAIPLRDLRASVNSVLLRLPFRTVDSIDVSWRHHASIDHRRGGLY